MTALLGLLDAEIGSKYSVTWETNKIGGEMNWMYADKYKLSCSGCGQPLSLIVQLYCPLADSQYHRTLYVLVCLSDAQCWRVNNGWTVLRSQCLDSSQSVSSKEAKTPVTMATDDWGCDMDDWGEHTAGTVASTTVSMGTENNNLNPSSANTQIRNEYKLQQTADCAVGNNTVAMVTVAGEGISGCATVPLNVSKCGGTNNTDDCHQIPNSKICDDNKISRLKQDICTINSEISDTSPDVLSLLHLKQMNIDNDDDFDDDKTINVEKTDSVVCATDMYIPSEETVSNMLDLLTHKHCDASVDKNRCTSSSATEHHELKAYFISVVEEPLSVVKVTGSDAHIQEMIRDYEHSHGVAIKDLLHNTEKPVSSSRGSSCSEAYEKAHVPHKDTFFHKFYKKIAQYPQQCIRYDWQGAPLYITEPDAKSLKMIGQSACVHCGGPMVFELQLMPALVRHLKAQGCDLEFGTVLIFTCKGSCWSDDDKTRVESVFVVADPDEDLFMRPR